MADGEPKQRAHVALGAVQLAQFFQDGLQHIGIAAAEQVSDDAGHLRLEGAFSSATLSLVDWVG